MGIKRDCYMEHNRKEGKNINIGKRQQQIDQLFKRQKSKSTWKKTRSDLNILQRYLNTANNS